MDPVRIMVIDDSLTVRKILEASLQRAGWDVSTFADGLEAMQALTHHTTPVPQLVVLDVGLPKVDGYHVARLLRHHPGFAHTPILMLSGHTGRLDKLRGRLAGAQGYLTEPFHPAEVLAVIQAHLTRQHGSLVQCRNRSVEGYADGHPLSSPDEANATALKKTSRGEDTPQHSVPVEASGEAVGV